MTTTRTEPFSLPDILLDPVKTRNELNDEIDQLNKTIASLKREQALQIEKLNIQHASDYNELSLKYNNAKVVLNKFQQQFQIIYPHITFDDYLKMMKGQFLPIPLTSQTSNNNVNNTANILTLFASTALAHSTININNVTTEINNTISVTNVTEKTSTQKKRERKLKGETNQRDKAKKPKITSLKVFGFAPPTKQRDLQSPDGNINPVNIVDTKETLSRHDRHKKY